ncbi:hypothetical protein [Exiguobacterium sp. s22]|uniref:hypothetical protein n=1 Tax=Exiguobacterium sp. s22 TaxID=2751272 RepID=UPI001BE7EA8D|nr:hypothetical protein [Exiguobacterium sp. s22]
MSQFDDDLTVGETAEAWARINTEAAAILQATRAGELSRPDRLNRLHTLCQDLALYRHLAGYDALIERLTNSVFHEEFTSTYRDKANDEYPIHSPRQLETRERELSPLDDKAPYDTRGVAHWPSTRRPRTVYEMTLLDRQAQKRNKARCKVYRDFVNGKADVAVWRKFTITDDTGGGL